MNTVRRTILFLLFGIVCFWSTQATAFFQSPIAGWGSDVMETYVHTSESQWGVWAYDPPLPLPPNLPVWYPHMSSSLFGYHKTAAAVDPTTGFVHAIVLGSPQCDDSVVNDGVQLFDIWEDDDGVVHKEPIGHFNGIHDNPAYANTFIGESVDLSAEFNSNGDMFVLVCGVAHSIVNDSLDPASVTHYARILKRAVGYPWSFYNYGLDNYYQIYDKTEVNYDGVNLDEPLFDPIDNEWDWVSSTASDAPNYDISITDPLQISGSFVFGKLKADPDSNRVFAFVNMFRMPISGDTGDFFSKLLCATYDDTATDGIFNQEWKGRTKVIYAKQIAPVCSGTPPVCTLDISSAWIADSIDISIIKIPSGSGFEPNTQFLYSWHKGGGDVSDSGIYASHIQWPMEGNPTLYTDTDPFPFFQSDPVEQIGDFSVDMEDFLLNGVAGIAYRHDSGIDYYGTVHYAGFGINTGTFIVSPNTKGDCRVAKLYHDGTQGNAPVVVVETDEIEPGQGVHQIKQWNPISNTSTAPQHCRQSLYTGLPVVSYHPGQIDEKRYILFTMASSFSSDPEGLAFLKNSLTVIAQQDSDQPDPTDGAIHFHVQFSEPIIPGTFLGSDISFLGSTVPGSLTATPESLDSGLGWIWKIHVTGMQPGSTGRVVVNIPAGVVTTTSGLTNLQSVHYQGRDNVVMYSDVTPPTVTLTPSPASQNTCMIGYTLTFSEPINLETLQNTDFSVSAESTAPDAKSVKIITNPSGDNKTFSVYVTGVVTPFPLTRTVIMNQLAANAVTDLAGNGISATNWSLTNRTVTMTWPTTLGVKVNQAPLQVVDPIKTQFDPTNVSPIGFYVVFSRPALAASFTASDVTIGGAAGGTKTVILTNPSNDLVIWYASVSGMTTAGTVTASIAKNKVVSSVGGLNNTVSTGSDNSVLWQP